MAKKKSKPDDESESEHTHSDSLKKQQRDKPSIFNLIFM
jgi:hypothetical protein